MNVKTTANYYSHQNYANKFQVPKQRGYIKLIKHARDFFLPTIHIYREYNLLASTTIKP